MIREEPAAGEEKDPLRRATRSSGRLLLLTIAIAGFLPPDVHPLASAALALAALLVAIALARDPDLPAMPAAAGVPLLASCALAGASALLAFRPVGALRVLTVWLMAGIVFAAARRTAWEAPARAVLALVVLVAAVQSAAGLWQAAVSFPDAAVRVEEEARAMEGMEAVRAEAIRARLASGRAVGFLGLPALLASIIVLSLPAAAAGAIASRGAARVLWGAGAAILAAGLAATRSLGGAASLVIAAALCSTRWFGTAASRRWILIALVGAAGLAVAMPRLAASGEESGLRALSLRAGNWQAAISMAIAHPAAGVGPGGYGAAFPRHRPPGGNETQRAHNSYLEAVSDLGLPIVPMLALLVAGFGALVGRRSEAKGLAGGDVWIARAVAAGCLAWALQNLVDYPAYVAGSIVPFMAMAGLMAGLGRDRGSTSRPAGAPTRILLVAATAAAAAFAVPDAISRWHQERAASAAREGDHDAALAAARAATRWNPWDPVARERRALSLVDAAARARPEGREPLAREALHEASEAVRLDPVTAQRRSTLARARLLNGDVAGAFAAISLAARLNPAREDYAADRDMLRERLERGADPP